MATISRLTPGQIVYDRHRYQMGNTTMSAWGTWEVRIIEVHADKGWVLASWNGNRPQRYDTKAIAKWRVKRPEPKPSPFDRAAKGCRNDG
jgi:hypothetical protein